MTIDLVINKRTHDLGGGFIVGRVLPFQARRMVGPFVFFDHMGPLELAAGISRELDVRPHPHIGLSTVTYLYNGQITHRDSLDFKQDIKPGEVNWMVSGKGITHSERLEYARAHGANMHGIQAWVALPNEYEEVDPAFHHREGADLPIWEDAGIKGRLIAGEIAGLKANVPSFSPTFYMHWDMEKGTRGNLSDEYSERAVYVTSGRVNIDGQIIEAGNMAIFASGGDITIVAEEKSTIMLLGGEPIGKRYIYWNFVSSSQDRLEQAKSDWKNGRMKLPDGDNQEFIPLPD